MMLHPALFSFPLETLLPFSHDGRAYRSFDHLIFPRSGELLLVPVWLSVGDLRSVVDGCPVPWAEVFDVLDAPSLTDSALDEVPPRLQALADGGWRMQSFRMELRTRTLRRFVHLSGVKFANLS